MKNNLPLIIAAFVIVIGAAVWFSKTPSAEPAPEVSAPVIATTTMPSKPAAPATPSAPAAPTPGTSVVPGIGVAVTTVWKTYRNDDWGIVFDYQPVWQTQAIKSKNGARIEQLTFSAKEGNIFLSRDIPVAEPAGLKYRTSTRVIAGQKVEVHEYTKPNEIYGSYVFFVLPVNRVDYYISISTFDSSKKFADDFIAGIEVKQ